MSRLSDAGVSQEVRDGQSVWRGGWGGKWWWFVRFVMPGVAEGATRAARGQRCRPPLLSYIIPRTGVNRAAISCPGGPLCAIVGHSTPAATPCRGRINRRWHAAITQRTRWRGDRERGGCRAGELTVIGRASRRPDPEGHCGAAGAEGAADTTVRGHGLRLRQPHEDQGGRGRPRRSRAAMISPRRASQQPGGMAAGVPSARRCLSIAPLSPCQ